MTLKRTKAKKTAAPAKKAPAKKAAAPAKKVKKTEDTTFNFQSALRTNLAESGGLQITLADSKAIVEAFTQTVADGIAASPEEKVSVHGLGIFRLTHRAARDGRNPRTGDSIKIPASVSPSFKSAAGFKRMFQG